MGTVSYELKDGFFYTFVKRHYCPICGKKMTTSYTNKVIPEKEADPRAISMGGVTFKGDLEIRYPFFWCPACDYKISIKKMKEYEKKKRQK